jgi:hypothetical protein
MKTLEALGKLKISEKLQVTELELNIATKKAVYREMNKVLSDPKMKFSALEFLCWVSTLYLIEEWKKQKERNLDNFKKVLAVNVTDTMNMFRLALRDTTLFVETIKSECETEEGFEVWIKGIYAMIAKIIYLENFAVLTEKNELNQQVKP